MDSFSIKIIKMMCKIFSQTKVFASRYMANDNNVFKYTTFEWIIIKSTLYHIHFIYVANVVSSRIFS